MQFSSPLFRERNALIRIQFHIFHKKIYLAWQAFIGEVRIIGLCVIFRLPSKLLIKKYDKRGHYLQESSHFLLQTSYKSAGAKISKRKEYLYPVIKAPTSKVIQPNPFMWTVWYQRIHSLYSDRYVTPY